MNRPSAVGFCIEFSKKCAKVIEVIIQLGIIMGKGRNRHSASIKRAKKKKEKLAKKNKK